MRGHVSASILIIFLLLAGQTAPAQVVISQIFPGGSTIGFYLNDYIELLNPTSTTFTLTNHSVQYGTATGNFGSQASNIYVFPNGITIGAGRYLLIKCGTTGTSGTAVTGYDLSTGNLDLSPNGGKLVVVNQTTALNLGAPATPLPLPDSRVLDLVAYGNSNNAEGSAAVNYGNSLTQNQVAVRKNAGLQDTNNNGADFDVLSAGGVNAPRNSSSPPVGTSGIPDWAVY
ncbi:MAG: lamin tail domain-containing protein [Candidatus Sumerlaeaceae bacterium]